MDYHSLNRKELQRLCKENKIPANLKNVEMANRLTSLLKGNKDVARGKNASEHVKLITLDDLIEDLNNERKTRRKKRDPISEEEATRIDRIAIDLTVEGSSRSKKQLDESVGFIYVAESPICLYSDDEDEFPIGTQTLSGPSSLNHIVENEQMLSGKDDRQLEENCHTPDKSLIPAEDNKGDETSAEDGKNEASDIVSEKISNFASAELSEHKLTLNFQAESVEELRCKDEDETTDERAATISYQVLEESDVLDTINEYSDKSAKKFQDRFFDYRHFLIKKYISSVR